MRHLLLLAVLMTTACDPFATAQKTDSVEGYETFLADNPSSPWRPQAEDRLQVLMFQEAKTVDTLPAYDAWLARFPGSSMRDDVMAARESSLFVWARDQNSPESWQAFINEYPTSKKRGNADRGLRTATFREHVTIGTPRASRTNLAENPDGPMNGWLIQADVTNTGDEPFKTVVLRPTSPESLSTLDWPVAAERWTMPLTDEQRRPLAPGETRTWSWTTGDLPETWDGEVTLILSDAAQ